MSCSFFRNRDLMEELLIMIGLILGLKLIRKKRNSGSHNKMLIRPPWLVSKYLNKFHSNSLNSIQRMFIKLLIRRLLMLIIQFKHKIWKKPFLLRKVKIFSNKKLSKHSLPSRLQIIKALQNTETTQAQYRESISSCNCYRHKTIIMLLKIPIWNKTIWKDSP